MNVVSPFASVSRLLAGVVLLLGVESSPLRAVPPSAGDDEFARETADYLGRLERLGLAGVVLVARADTPIFAAGYGMADREAGIPWSPGTVSTIGSITKQFTAAAIMRLAGEGKLSVEDPLGRHFSGVPEDKAGITLHHLLTHSSGILDLEGFGDFDPIGREEFVRRILEQPLGFAPGTSYEYSNANYSLLGAIVEQLTGSSYEEYLVGAILGPLGLFETGYLLPQWGRLRLAQGYRAGERWGTVLERPMAPDGPYWALRANGGIHSTAFDMLRWAEALRLGRVVPAAALERMWTPWVREGDEADSSYGYGWVVLDLPDGTRVVQHNGGNGIFFADLAIVPAAGVVVFLQTNVVADVPMAQTLLEQIGMRLAAGRPYPEVPRRAGAPPAGHRSGSLEGDYELAAGGWLHLSEIESELVMRPADSVGFSRLLSQGPPDLARTAEVTTRAGELAAALLAHDLAAIRSFYSPGTPAAQLDMVWSDRLQGIEERLGRLSAHEVLGAARRDDVYISPVRIAGERGSEVLAFAWASGAERHLLGVSLAGIPLELRFFPEENGGWASWDPRSGHSRTLKVVSATDGPTELRLETPIGEMLARRAQ